MIRIYLIDDNPGILEAMDSLFSVDQTACLLAGKATSMKTALKEISVISPDIILLDLNLRDGKSEMGTFLTFKEQFPCIPVIILSGESDLFIQDKMMEAGASAYLIKGIDTVYDKMVDVMKQVEKGYTLKNQRVAPLHVLHDPQQEIQGIYGSEEIIEYLAKGLTPSQISKKIHQDASTIRKKIGRIKQCLKVETNAELIYKLFSSQLPHS